MFEQVELLFSGSFQCRMATDPDATGDSRADPYGEIRQPPAMGWTFDYGETRFDRVIRFADPVDLRNLLVDAFEPVRVRTIRVKLEAPFGVDLPWQEVPADPLLGAAVSLGGHAVFDTAAGQGPGREAILGCHVAVGPLLVAEPVSTPVLTGVERRPEWTAEYLTRKPQLLAAAVLAGVVGPTRRKVLTEVAAIQPPVAIRLENYAAFFGMQESTATVPATIDFDPSQASGLLVQLLLGWTWTLDLTFSRFDGDTLTGRVQGRLAGRHTDV